MVGAELSQFAESGHTSGLATRWTLVALGLLGSVLAGTLVGLGRVDQITPLLVLIGTMVVAVLLRLWGLGALLPIFALVSWAPTGFGFYASDVWGNMYLGEVIIYVGLLLWLVRAARPWSQGKENRLRSPFIGWLVLFALLGVIASTQAANPRWAATGLRVMCLYSLATYVLTTNVVSSAAEAERLLKWVLLGGCLLIVVFYFANPQEAMSYAGGGRLGGMLVAPKGETMIWAPVLAAYCALLLPFVFSIALLDHTRLARLLAAMAGMVLTLALVLSGGRGGWIAAGIGVVVVMATVLRLGKVGWQSLVALGGVAALLSAVAAHLAREIEPFSELSARLASLSDIWDEPNFVGRYVLWVQQWQLAWDNPLGVGPGSFEALTGWGNHSTWVVMTVEVGIMGAVAYGIFLVSYTLRCVLGLRSCDSEIRRICVGSLGSVVALMVGGISETLFSYYWVVGPVWIIFGATMAAVEVADREGSGPGRPV